MDFKDLPAEVQATIREKQAAKKQELKKRKVAEQGNGAPPAPQSNSAGGLAQPNGGDSADDSRYPCRITQSEYFSAASGGLFRDPNLGPTEDNLELLLGVLSADDNLQARQLGTCNYFMFAGGQREIWNPRFNAKLAYEGFFTITTGHRGPIEPLPELQPFYSVLTWPNFERSKHVRKALGRIRRSNVNYRLVNCANPDRTWSLLNDYHKRKYGENWLTKEYFKMMRAASDDPAINFRLQCVEMYAVDAEPAPKEAAPAPTVPKGFGISSLVSAVRGRGSDQAEQPAQPRPLAGEVGFSIGNIYTSLSGWTEELTSESLGTAQLVLLGRWLQRKGYVFWSLGHCYSPEMDYKRQLGHRVYPRRDFLALLKKHRGRFDLAQGAARAHPDCFLDAGEEIESMSLAADSGHDGES